MKLTNQAGSRLDCPLSPNALAFTWKCCKVAMLYFSLVTSMPVLQIIVSGMEWLAFALALCCVPLNVVVPAFIFSSICPQRGGREKELSFPADSNYSRSPVSVGISSKPSPPQILKTVDSTKHVENTVRPLIFFYSNNTYLKKKTTFLSSATPASPTTAQVHRQTLGGSFLSFPPLSPENEEDSFFYMYTCTPVQNLPASPGQLKEREGNGGRGRVGAVWVLLFLLPLLQVGALPAGYLFHTAYTVGHEV